MPYRILIFVTFVAVLLAGCQPTTSPSEFSTEQVCKDLVLFKSSLAKLQAMQGSASPQELDAQLSVVRQNFLSVTQSAANLSQVNLTALEEQVNNLATAREALPADASTQDVLQELSDELDAVGKAVNQLTSGLNCVE